MIRRSLLFTIILLLFISLSAVGKVSVIELKTNNLTNPLGLNTATPTFSWMTTSDKKEVVQTAYHILVASSKELLEKNKADLWDSGYAQSDKQLWINYDGKQLNSNARAYWKVKIYTNRGESSWSETASFGIGLLGETRWSGRWIGMEQLLKDEQRGLHTRLAARYLRKKFTLKHVPIKRATAHVTGLGLYRFYINETEFGRENVLKPAPSDYRKTIYYNTYDVTYALDTATVVGIILGNGRLFPMRQNKLYKTPVFGFPKCRMNILIEYADGSSQKLVTDESWKVTANGPIRANNEYDGEEYDARQELDGWTMASYDDSTWQWAQRTDIPTGTLRGQETPAMHASFYSKPLSATHKGNTIILDFGQNMAGWIAFQPHGKAGDTIRIRYAERLNVDGTLYTDNLRDALSEDIYICNGREKEAWQPSFVYHGFRYAEVSGMPSAQKSDFEAYHVEDFMVETGHFNCSDSTLNRVIHNAIWGIRSNYKGMPIDCPQRNERQPWLGDRTAGSLGESFLFDNERLYTKWMRDICESQREDGCIPDVAPAFWNYYTDDVTWPAALPFTCDMLFRQYGNIQPILDAYPYMKRWMNHIITEYIHNGIITKDKYGDWCVPPETLELIHSNDPARKTDGSLIATAYTIRCLQLLEKFANLLDNDADATLWQSKSNDISAAFNRTFLTLKRNTSLAPGHTLYPDSIFYGNNTATSNLLPLAFNMVPDSIKDEIIKNIVTNIISLNGGHVPCGVIGISWLLTALSDNGFADVAYLLATNKTYPSWGYMAENGATTIWELWNGDKASPKMNSGNHIMLLGDLITWCYSHLSGIRPGQNNVAEQVSAAYHHFTLKPDFNIPDCSAVSASYTSPYGTIASRWQKTLTHVEWDVEIPCNTTAEIHFPNGNTKCIGSGIYHFSTKIPTSDAAIVEDEFLYEHATFPQCHASTIVETKDGDLVAAYFGGKHERNPDVCIWVSRKTKGETSWSTPILAADGVFISGSADATLAGIDSTTTAASVGPVCSYHTSTDRDLLKRKACWNPVLFEMPNGELWLFYKIGLSVSDWTGWLTKSNDGGRTWNNREPLPKGFLGPVKNKPEIVNNRLICASSTEKGGWKLHFEILNLTTGTWSYIGPIEAEMSKRTDRPGEIKPIDCIQPSILRLADGRLQVLCRTRNGRLATSFSNDDGNTWSKVTLTDIPNNQSGTDAVTLADGTHVLVYNNFSTLPGTPKGPRTPLSIATSSDGTHWQHAITLEDSPISQYSYPAIIQGCDGSLHCVYTWRRQRIAYKKIDIDKLK